MTILRRDLFHVLDAPLAMQVGWQEIGELAQALGFAARSEQRLAKAEIGHGFGQAKAQLRVAFVDSLRKPAGRYPAIRVSSRVILFQRTHTASG